jgi:hypothetical protein
VLSLRITSDVRGSCRISASDDCAASASLLFTAFRAACSLAIANTIAFHWSGVRVSMAMASLAARLPAVAQSALLNAPGFLFSTPVVQSCSARSTYRQF